MTSIFKRLLNIHKDISHSTPGHFICLLLPIHDLKNSFPFPRTIIKILIHERMGKFFPFSNLILGRHKNIRTVQDQCMGHVALIGLQIGFITINKQTLLN